ncbi:MAG: heavy metal-binding domain-containing protein [Gemmatimonadales bacterium]|uniref:YbjQ family protein n=1 Tax=Candidatus Palauibacter TaxID=3056650 RepID=UPI00137FE325|nr:heavy metal-binding domain-containing protein [Candidatus Palauibacter polyketidifaciens]MXW56808.1 heavy metal-binding domain-containing protein [Gemmatimonadales bacterium]MDE2720603.1 heavy metal-binding domain-containing protein [Candidatus Palauibacter polyketidifaciens]MXX70227.1 heavy metal-binding domain-containing protein [Gemmatimonadales bacterium]MYE34057.1 heavy metal-binding domain-containing protein [Gemmatimonadales bacterium]MYG18705.1 heavy metal-binding domain-containing 
MIITSRNDLAGYRILEEFGLVRGSTIRARHLGRDILAGLKTIVGGEIQEYTKMMAEAREQAVDRMEAEAAAAGANAILCVRFSTSYILGGTAEIVVYGSAVKVEES